MANDHKLTHPSPARPLMAKSSATALQPARPAAIGGFVAKAQPTTMQGFAVNVPKTSGAKAASAGPRPYVHPPIARRLEQPSNAARQFYTPDIANVPDIQRLSPRVAYSPPIVDQTLAVFFPPSLLVDQSLRMQGAWIHPADQVVVAFLTFHPSGATIFTARIDANRSSRTFGGPVGTQRVVATTTGNVLGFSSASVKISPRGTLDAVFAYYDDVHDGTLSVFTARGDGGHEPPSVVATGRTFADGSRVVVDPVLPLLCVGKDAFLRQRLLFAFSESTFGAGGDAPLETRIRVGFLVRDGGRWVFEEASRISAGATLAGVDTKRHPAFNIAGAFDSNRDEWVLAWIGPDSGVFGARIALDGTVLWGSELLARFESGDWHSGSVVSFNQTTNRFLFQADHDVFWGALDPSSGAIRCLDNAGLMDASSLMCGGPGVGVGVLLLGRGYSEFFRLATGAVWASAPSYTPGFEFHLGGQYGFGDPRGGTGNACLANSDCYPGSVCVAGHCVTPEGLPSEPGVSGVLRIDSHTWELEQPLLWQARVGETVALQHYVRLPRAKALVALFASRNDAGGGEVRYTMIEQPWDDGSDDPAE